MRIQVVTGAAGTKLHVREYGAATGVPILLIHGWSQSHLCWSKQYGSELKSDTRIVALDLRGHGMSDAPAEVDVQLKERLGDPPRNPSDELRQVSEGERLLVRLPGALVAGDTLEEASRRRHLGVEFFERDGGG